MKGINITSITLYSTVAFSSLFQSCAFQVLVPTTGGGGRPSRPTSIGIGIEPAPTNTNTIHNNHVMPDDSFGSRRQLITSLVPSAMIIAGVTLLSPQLSFAEDVQVDPADPVIVAPTGEIKKLFNEGRALEQQGNIQASQRIFAKVTKLAPRFIYGWAYLGNSQVALGSLDPAENSYTKAVNLCVESRKEEEKLGIPRCNDLYLLYLNRGSLRLNNGMAMAKEALLDLEAADSLRAKPDAVILQNLARAREVNGLYAASDRDYTVAISMTSNEVSPFWLRAALVKFQLGDTMGSFDLIRRVENRFSEAPEVRAALAAMLYAKGDQDTARKKFLEIPDRQRLKYRNDEFLLNTISWPPRMIDNIKALSDAVGDAGRVEI